VFLALMLDSGLHYPAGFEAVPRESLPTQADGRGAGATTRIQAEHELTGLRKGSFMFRPEFMGNRSVGPHQLSPLLHGSPSEKLGPLPMATRRVRPS